MSNFCRKFAHFSSDHALPLSPITCVLKVASAILVLIEY